MINRILRQRILQLNRTTRHANHISNLNGITNRNFTTSPILLKKSKKNDKNDLTPPGSQFYTYCDILEDDRPLFNFQEHYQPVFDEILKLSHNEINQVKLGITAADLEEIQLTINDENYELGEIALVTKVKEREIDIDLVEFPDLIDQIYDDVYKIFRDQLNMTKEKNNDKIVITLKKVTPSTRKGRLLRLKDIKKEAMKISDSHIKSSIQEIENTVKNDDDLRTDQDIQYFLKSQLPKFFKKYQKEMFESNLDILIGRKEEELKNSGNL